MADIGMPQISITFKGLGANAVARSQGGRTAVLIVKDEAIDKFAEYKTIDDFGSEEQEKYTPENVEYIKQALEGIPKRLIVANLGLEDTLTDLLKEVKGKVEMNCWMAIADADSTETDDLVTFVKGSNTNDKKRYKALVYQATATDDMHIVNLVNDDAEQHIPYLLGFLAGLTLDMSSIAFPLQRIESVIEPDDLDAAINDGGFVLFNDEGDVRVARGVNSLTTTGEGITDDMKFILIVEVMDMIYTDIYTTWNNHYKGKFKNSLDNQMLLIGAIGAYWEGLENDMLLDPNFDNKVEVNVEQQRLANIPKYGKEEVDTWDDERVMQMTVGTNVFLKAQIKILNAMEDFEFNIDM